MPHARNAPPTERREIVLNRFARALFTRIFTPTAAFLVRRGVSPDVVTLIGTAGVAAGALVFFPRGEFFWGTIVITCFVFSDLVDGTMARMTERSSRWGAWLDSTLDRVGDAAVFGGIALWYAGRGDDQLMVALCLYCLATGAIVSYARARAEGLGMTANVGVTERADRLVAILVATGFDGLGVPYVQAAALWLLAVGSTVTIAQRALAVRRQALAETP
jgi:CDP-diacylglycerol--glycerol-3-phosphate 3-phosphatidyltransferase